MPYTAALNNNTKVAGDKFIGSLFTDLNTLLANDVYLDTSLLSVQTSINTLYSNNGGSLFKDCGGTCTGSCFSSCTGTCVLGCVSNCSDGCVTGCTGCRGTSKVPQGIRMEGDEE